MSNELTTTNKELAVCTDIANDYSGLPRLQNQLIEWAKAKLVEVQAEYTQLDEAHREAKLRKWKASTLLGAANKCLRRVEFYDKVVAALEAGYMLFPPIDDLDIIAIRTEYDTHQDAAPCTTQTYMSTPGGGWDSKTEAPALGEGEYKNPRVRWTSCGNVKIADGSERKNWQPEYVMENPEFPLVMARAQCIEATSAAMENRFFDSIAIYPRRARKDPVILGRIHDPKGRIMNFLISWRIDKRDI